METMHVEIEQTFNEKPYILMILHLMQENIW